MDSPDDTPRFGLANICVSLLGQRILRNMDFDIAPGEIHALVGKQNEGKTTLCKLFLGEVKADAGTVRIGKHAYPSLTPRLAKKAGIEYVGNHAQVFPNLTLAENLTLGTLRWWDNFGLWRMAVRKLERWLDSFSIKLPLMSPLSSLRRVDWLFVMLLNRLYRRPKLLLLDETLEQLEPDRYREAMSIIKSMLREGMRVVWITHKIEDSLERADRVTVLRRGRILFSDKVQNLDRISLLRLCYSELGGNAEEEEITREQFYELMNLVEGMLKDMPVAVIISDLEGRVRFVNKSALAMFPQGSNLSRPKLDRYFTGSNRLAELATAHDNSGDTISVWHNLSISNNNGNGKERLVDMQVRSIRERGVTIGSMIIIEDVTDREEMRKKLALSDNLASIGLLAAGVAHEVNDPLAIISNYLGFIRHESEDPQVTSAANLAQEETMRIQQIVENLVAFSGNRPPGSEYVDLTLLAKELCHLLRFHNPWKSVRFVCTGPETPLLVKIDHNEIRQVYLNLFRNSLDAMKGDGVIRVDGFLEDDGKDRRRVKVVVSDNGAGLVFDNPSDVFKPFVTTKKGKGAHQGLGLSIVYGIVEKYGGSITLCNLATGGCQVTLTFPCVEQETDAS